MKDDEKIKHLLRIAKIRFNFSLTLIAMTILSLIYFEWLPETVKKPATKKIAKIETVVDFTIDTSEVKNGIHVPSGLIVDTGYNQVLNTCQKCHSIDIVKQNRATKEGWKKMITWMQKTQGLWELGENEAPIINYLAKNYAPTNSGRRKNLENIVWYELR